MAWPKRTVEGTMIKTSPKYAGTVLMKLAKQGQASLQKKHQG